MDTSDRCPLGGESPARLRWLHKSLQISRLVLHRLTRSSNAVRVALSPLISRPISDDGLSVHDLAHYLDDWINNSDVKAFLVQRPGSLLFPTQRNALSCWHRGNWKETMATEFLSTYATPPRGGEEGTGVSSLDLERSPRSSRYSP